MKSSTKELNKTCFVNDTDPKLWDRLVWQRAFDKALREKIAKQYRTEYVSKNNFNLRTH